MNTSMFFLVAVALFCAGCSPLGSIVGQMNAITPVADAAILALEDQYKSDLKAADDPEKVRRCYAASFEAHRAFVESWAAAREAVAFAASLENAGAVAVDEIGMAIRTVESAVKAYESFRKLVDGELRCGSLTSSEEFTATLHA